MIRPAEMVEPAREGGGKASPTATCMGARFQVDMGVEPKIEVFTPKMDGENNGSKPY